MSGQLVHEINVCTVPYFNQFPYLSFTSLCSFCYFISHFHTLCVTRHLTVYSIISSISNYKTEINVYSFNCKTLLVLFLLSQTTILHSNYLSTVPSRQTDFNYPLISYQQLSTFAAMMANLARIMIYPLIPSLIHLIFSATRLIISALDLS